MTDSLVHHPSETTREIALESAPPVQVPCPITGQVAMVALFSAPTREARKLLPSRRLKPVELYPGTTAVGLACMEYGHIRGLMPFSAASVFVPVHYGARVDLPLLPVLLPKLFKNAGYYFHRLFVTRPSAVELSTKLYGQRATLADIAYNEQPYWRHASVSVEGKLVFSLELKKPRTRTRQLSTHTYSLHEGSVLGTPLPMHGELGFARGERAGRFVLGEHYVADELRALSLGAEPLATMYGSDIASTLALPDRALPA